MTRGPALGLRLAGLLIALVAATSPLARAMDLNTRFGWMIGTWEQTRGRVTVQESWTADETGILSGVGRTRRPGKLIAEERMTIQAQSGGVTFTAELPDQSSTAFTLRPSPAGVAVFENIAHDFPQRITYRRCGRDLCARVEGVSGGQPTAQSWRYRRVW